MIKIFNSKFLYYLISLIISTFNGIAIKDITGIEISNGNFGEYFFRALIFGYLLTAIVYGGIFVSSSLLQKDFSDIAKKNDEKLFLYSSVCSFLIVLFFKFIIMNF